MIGNWRGVVWQTLVRSDKAFDVDWILQELDERGAIAGIPPKANRKMQRDYDTHMYK